MVICLCTTALMAQVTEIKVVDRVDIPLALSAPADPAGSLEFIEAWSIDAGRPGMSKKVDSLSTSGISRDAFWKMVKGQALAGGKVQWDDVSHEFMLMDPETGQANRLHAPFVSLVSLHSERAGSYRIQDQLLSVQFHETWSLDPDSRMVEKRVRGITPVIWQRRQTTDGEPINDGDTGLPVYFKIELDRIDVRNL